MNNPIHVKVLINKDIETVWRAFNDPVANTVWNTGHPDWHTPKSEIDLRVGGQFTHHMAAKDGSMAFDFTGEFTKVEEPKLLAYTILGDGRKVEVKLEETSDGVWLHEFFEAENMNSRELQEQGWQGILQNLKSYVEGL